MFQQFQQGEEEEVFKIIFISGKVSCLGLKKKLTLASFFGSDKLKNRIFWTGFVAACIICRFFYILLYVVRFVVKQP